jgi:hypothetical protein
MTQEHREQFLAAEGWQQTERGHIRVERFERVPDDPFIPPGIHYVVTSIQPHPRRERSRMGQGARVLCVEASGVRAGAHRRTIMKYLAILALLILSASCVSPTGPDVARTCPGPTHGNVDIVAKDAG